MSPGTVVKQPSSRLRWFKRLWMIAVISLVLASLLVGGGYFWLKDSRLVAIEQVEIMGINSDSEPVVKKLLTASAQEMTTLNVDVKRLQAAVANQPEIKQISATPDFPHTLRIDVQERYPVAVVESPERRIPVSEDGVFLPDAKVPPGTPAVPVSTLPLGRQLTSQRAFRDVKLIAAAPVKLRSRIAKITTTENGLTTELSNGATLYFGTPTKLSAKWIAATRLLADPQIAGATYIDLRIAERPAVGGLGGPSEITVEN